MPPQNRGPSVWHAERAVCMTIYGELKVETHKNCRFECISTTVFYYYAHLMFSKIFFKLNLILHFDLIYDIVKLMCLLIMISYRHDSQLWKMMSQPRTHKTSLAAFIYNLLHCTNDDKGKNLGRKNPQLSCTFTHLAPTQFQVFWRLLPVVASSINFFLWKNADELGKM